MKDFDSTMQALALRSTMSMPKVTWTMEIWRCELLAEKVDAMRIGYWYAVIEKLEWVRW